ncbi:MAG: hypothetical protein JWM99_1735 [Verrucomicrobiales bacterium]|nr:hypothetical protein [Verrucomicrobiales bacterium]
MRVIQIANEKVPFGHFHHRQRSELRPAGRNLSAEVSSADISLNQMPMYDPQSALDARFGWESFASLTGD